MSIDRQLIARKISLISQDLEQIKALSRLTRREFLADITTRVVAERYLERMIGRMIDINYHLVTEAGKPPPPDYYQSFTALGDQGLLDPEFARAIASAAGLRNRLVHEYDEVDPVKLFEALAAAARDVPRYIQAVASLL